MLWLPVHTRVLTLKDVSPVADTTMIAAPSPIAIEKGVSPPHHTICLTDKIKFDNFKNLCYTIIVLEREVSERFGNTQKDLTQFNSVLLLSLLWHWSPIGYGVDSVRAGRVESRKNF